MGSLNEIRPLAVITGASSGIGYELAKVFARNRFDLIIAAEDPRIHGVATELKSYGGEIQSVQVDLATEKGVKKLYDRIREAGRPVDSVVMNAGVGVGGEFVTTKLEEELNLIELNVVSLIRLTKLVLPDMIARGRGRLLYTSSIAAEMPGPYYAVYAASKAFVQSFSEAIRNEVKDKGVTVTALQPGATETNFFARANMMNTKAGESAKDDPAEVAQDGFDAMMEGRDHVIAGSLKNRFQVGISKFVSEKQGAAIQGKQTKPKSLN